MIALPSTAFQILGFLIGALASATALAQGTVIFSGGDVSIIASDGSSRQARQGDVLRQGERIATGANSMAQVRFADGSLAGVRPDSNVELRQYNATGADQGVTLVLATGGVRVLNVETAGSSARLPMQVQSPEGANVILRGGDLETGRARGQPAEQSFVARVNAGTAFARTSAGDLPLAANAVNGIGRAGVTPMPPNALPPSTPMLAQYRSGTPGKAPPGGPGTAPQATSPGTQPRTGGPVAPLQGDMASQPLPPGGTAFAPPSAAPGFRPGPGPQPGVPVGAQPPQFPVAPTAASSMIGNISKPPATTANTANTPNTRPAAPGTTTQNPPQFVAPPPGGSTTLGAGGPGGTTFQGTTIKPPPR